jgi:hypothetical protein
MMASQPVPDGLAGSADVWAKITESYELRTDELRLLEDACREMDLIDRMHADLAVRDFFTVGSMGQPVMSPLVAEIRQHRMVLASLLRALKLPDDAGAPAVNQQRQAGNASWASRSRGA